MGRAIQSLFAGRHSGEEHPQVTVLAQRPPSARTVAWGSVLQRARSCLGSQPSGKASCPNGNMARSVTMLLTSSVAFSATRLYCLFHIRCAGTFRSVFLPRRVEPGE